MGRFFAACVALACYFGGYGVAHAQKLFTPVEIIRDTRYCQDVAMLLFRQSLQEQQRTESLNGTQSTDIFTGMCGAVPAGKWMFYDGYYAKNPNYVCLRPRLGADCLWFPRQDVGEVFEAYPGYPVDKSNKGISCAAWRNVVTRSQANTEMWRQKWLATKPPTNVGQQLFEGLIGGAVGVDTVRARSANSCLTNFHYMQELARRITAYRFCPSLGADGVSERAMTEYQSLAKYVSDFCLGN